MTHRAPRRTAAGAAVVACLLGLAGCGGSLKEAAVGGVASYETGKAAFDRGDYIDAIADLKAYVEQFPGTEDTDDALFYLGEAYFRTKDFALASGQYDRVIRDFPQSPLQPDAMYQLARCDDLQARSAALDQTETTRAISRYQSFLQLYPESPKAGDANSRIAMLNDRLAEKRFRNGRLYVRLKQYDAAAHYLRGVMMDFPSSPWAGEAGLLLADVLVKQGKQDEAEAALRAVGESKATPGAKKRAEQRLREIEGRGKS
ncbi:MAG: outer membrane protein assembly factor BamD [Candidatus Eiseniibacteriota bacterium]